VTITEIPNGWGSQASLVGGIIQSAAAFHDAEQMGELYHELSHLWNVKDVDSPSPRWNEGLASFLQGLLQERVDGWTGRNATDAWVLGRLRKKVASDSLLSAVPFIDYGKRGITDESYWVGHVLFGTLFELVGEQQFHRIIGGYYQRYADGGTTQQLVAFARRNASRDLTPFFDDWLFSTRWTGRIGNGASMAELAEHYRAKTGRGR
jgi:aminopeptidase N